MKYLCMIYEDETMYQKMPEAQIAYERALQLARQEPVQRLLRLKLNELMTE